MKTNKEKDALLEQLKKTPIIQIACEKIGLSRTTYYRWYQADL
jgi:ACT domain-containing protein